MPDIHNSRAPGGVTVSPAAVTPYSQRASSTTASGSPPRASRKRGRAPPTGEPGFNEVAPVNRRKAQKVSRACDYCRQLKAKCSGTLPCTTCAGRGLTCLYNARYSRGRPRTPPLASDYLEAASQQPAGIGSGSGPGELQTTRSGPPHDMSLQSCSQDRHLGSDEPSSRTSPELGVAEIEGQVFGPTSGVTFLRRAWKRLAMHESKDVDPDPDQPRDNAPTNHQHMMLERERPVPKTTEEDLYRLVLPDHEVLVQLLAQYFDISIPTYRVLHQPSVETWLQIVEDNVRQGKPAWEDLGKPKAAIVLGCLSVATPYYLESTGAYPNDDAAALARSDHLFCACKQMSEAETIFPSLESAQVRIIQTLYLLHTFRMNQAWNTFGNALQLVSALGLHRNTAVQQHLAPTTIDYLHAQLRIRTFWSAYILDKYLGVIFGRPRHYNDEDIDQDLPDRVEDEDMTSQGPSAPSRSNQLGCRIDALICHVKIVRIISQVSKEVYAIKSVSEEERMSAAHRLSKEIHEWKSGLPAYLGLIHPSMLIANFRRQAVVLRLNYCHALLHANRIFLLASFHEENTPRITDCINTARTVFELVEDWVKEGPIFHVFWWAPYVMFNALVVSYVWDIQLKRRRVVLAGEELANHKQLMELARRCQALLANAPQRNWPSHWYAIILEEFCSEAMGRKRPGGGEAGAPDMQPGHVLSDTLQPAAMGTFHYPGLVAADPVYQSTGYSLLDEWNATDWLELDSSLQYNVGI